MAKSKKSTAKKPARPAAKAVKKAVAPKKPAKPVAKKAVKPARKAAKPAPKAPAKKAAKPAAKKPVAKKPVKAAPSRPAAKVAVKPAPKAATRPAPPAQKPAVKNAPVIMKKTEPVSKNNGKVTSKQQEDNRSRYSDEELREFKILIDKKLEEATRDYDLLKATLSHKDDHGTDDTSPTFKLLEDGSDVLSKEETAHLAARQEKYIQNLKNALIRIQNKTYGICRVTGKLIPKERLRSVPHATLSIDAKLDQYR